MKKPKDNSPPILKKGFGLCETRARFFYFDGNLPTQNLYIFDLVVDGLLASLNGWARLIGDEEDHLKPKQLPQIPYNLINDKLEFRNFLITVNKLIKWNHWLILNWETPSLDCSQRSWSEFIAQNNTREPYSKKEQYMLTFLMSLFNVSTSLVYLKGD